MRTTVLIGMVIALLALAGGSPADGRPRPMPAASQAPSPDLNGDGHGDLAIGVPGEDHMSGSDQWDYELFGAVLAAADLGRADHAELVIGVPGEGLRGAPDAGQVHVLHGSAASGLTTTRNQVWHQDSMGIAGAAEPGDAFGFAVAASKR